LGKRQARLSLIAYRESLIAYRESLIADRESLIAIPAPQVWPFHPRG